MSVLGWDFQVHGNRIGSVAKNIFSRMIAGIELHHMLKKGQMKNSENIPIWE